MTREEKIIATAFTGKMFIDGSEMDSLYEYMEKKVGYGVIDLMLTSKEFWEELHKACEQDFIDMVSKEQPSLPSNLDEAAEEIVKDWLAYGDGEYKKLVKAGAEWQYQKDRAEFAKLKAKEWQEGYDEGAKWQAGQGSSREVEVKEDAGGYPYIDIHIELYDYDTDAPLAKKGDNVIVQIRKK